MLDYVDVVDPLIVVVVVIIIIIIVVLVVVGDDWIGFTNSIVVVGSRFMVY